MKKITALVLILTVFLAAHPSPASMSGSSITLASAQTVAATENGYDLWLRQRPITNETYLNEVLNTFKYIVSTETDGVVTTAKTEFAKGLNKMTGQNLTQKQTVSGDGALVIGTKNSSLISEIAGSQLLNGIPKEGYIIKSGRFNGSKITVIAGGDANGALYGAFKLLEMVQCEEFVRSIDYSDAPRIQWRVLDQWDNWNRTIERGYAGSSIYKWSELPDVLDERYTDFARANASIGINTIVINNVNAQKEYIETANIPKVAAIANVFRAYGIRLALTVRFDSPIAIGGLGTSDPLNSNVVSWWESKFDEIYSAIPDFAGILVKADSEGQPGPSSYGRTHAEGANMFSEIFKKRNDAIVMWRAFVYGPAANSLSSERVNQAYEFFKPWDGKFNDNVVVQSKNGALDFLPREPVAPLFGGMTKTNMGIELQITQEYTGQSTHLCYLIPMWKSYFDFDLKVSGEGADISGGTTLDKIVDGTVFGRTNTLVAGVSNIGADTNWTRLELAQANWFGFGKLAWNPSAEQNDITDTWIKMTFGCDDEVAAVVGKVLDESWEVFESYSSPYSMGMTVKSSNHFDPDLDSRNNNNYIKVDSAGIGHNRNSTSTGNKSNAAIQYSSTLNNVFNNINTCPEEYLFWFHHVPYNYAMSNGKTMLENVYGGLSSAKQKVLGFKESFSLLEGKIDSDRMTRIQNSFDEQYAQTIIWVNAMSALLEKHSGVSLYPKFNNLALNKTAVASQVRNNWTANMAVDGNRSDNSSRWATNQTDENHYIMVDLGSVKTVNRADIYWENFSMRYIVETAVALTNPDGSTPTDWTIAAEGAGGEWSSAAFGKAASYSLFENREARYVRMRTTEKNSGLWNSLYEFEVFGDDFSDTAKFMLQRETELAQGCLSFDAKPECLSLLQIRISEAKSIINNAAASDSDLLSAYWNLKAAFRDMKYDDLARGAKVRRNTVTSDKHAGNTVDGNPSTFWQAENGSSQAELTVDFRREVTLNKIELVWRQAASTYKIEVPDGTGGWILVKQVTRTGATDNLDTIELDSPLTTQIVKMTTILRSNELALTRFSAYNTAEKNSAAKTDLITAIGAAKESLYKIQSGDFTANSSALFLAKLLSAETALADSLSDDGDYAQAANELQTALAGLTPIFVIAQKSFTAVYGDESIALSATNSSESVTWTSDNSGVVSVGTDGKAEFVGVGKAVITAWDGQNTSQITITVRKAIQEQIKISNVNENYRLSDGSISLSATGGSGNGATAWSSSDSSVATVSANGTVTIVGTGTVKITVVKEADSNHTMRVVDTVTLTIGENSGCSCSAIGTSQTIWIAILSAVFIITRRNKWARRQAL